jgi:hypothetical protein
MTVAWSRGPLPGAFPMSNIFDDFVHMIFGVNPASYAPSPAASDAVAPNPAGPDPAAAADPAAMIAGQMQLDAQKAQQQQMDMQQNLQTQIFGVQQDATEHKMQTADAAHKAFDSYSRD